MTQNFAFGKKQSAEHCNTVQINEIQLEVQKKDLWLLHILDDGSHEYLTNVFGEYSSKYY